MKSITWKAKESDVVHTIPEGARVSFNKDIGTITLEFNEDDEVTYLRESKDAKALRGWILHPGEFGDDPTLKEFIRVAMGQEGMMALASSVLDGMVEDEAAESAIRLIEDLCDRYPGVTELFAERLRAQDMMDKTKMCQFCGLPVEDSGSHGEGKCFDYETEELKR